MYHVLLIVMAIIGGLLAVMITAAVLAPKMIGSGASGIVPEETPSLSNQTGGAIAQYGVVCLDLLRTAAATTSLDTAFRNAVSVASTHVTNGGRFYVAQAAAASGALFPAMGRGLTQCKISGTVARNTLLMPSATHDYLVPLSGSVEPVARWLDGDNASGAATGMVDFFGSAGHQ